MINEIRKTIATTKARQGLDKRGYDSRRPLLQMALTDRIPLADIGGQKLHDGTRGMDTVNWRCNLRDLYSGETLNVGLNTGTDNWTTRTWWRFQQDPAVLHGSNESGFLYTPIHIAIATNPYGGFEWDRQLLFDAGYGPVKATFPGAGVAHYIQHTTTKIDLLNKAGGTIKTASVDTVWQFDFTPGTPDVTVESKDHGAWTFDTNGPITEFFGIKVSLTLTDSPTWIDALNNTYFFALTWIIGFVE